MPGGSSKLKRDAASCIDRPPDRGTQISISTPREIGGRMLPRGSIIDLRENGQIQETFTRGEQQQLARDREERRKERERHEQRCKEVCGPVTDFAENDKCMASCRS